MKAFKVADKDIGSLLVEARECSATASNAKLPRGLRVEATGRLLEAVADLSAADSRAQGVEQIDGALVQEALQCIDADKIEQAADDIERLLAEVIADPHAEGVAERVGTLVNLLSVRHSAGRRLQGAEILGLPAVATDQQKAAFEYFDNLVRPMAWAMAFANEQRDPWVRRITPRNRKAAWWWSEGIDLEWRAVQLVTETAELMARYPTFERYLDKTAAAARARRSVPNGAQGSAMRVRRDVV